LALFHQAEQEARVSSVTRLLAETLFSEEELANGSLTGGHFAPLNPEKIFAIRSKALTNFNF